MRVVADRAGWRAELEEARRQGSRVGLVPTMGALHPGHASLVSAARRRCDLVTTTIFVNPLQFGDAADLDAYPKVLDADLELLEPLGCDLVFAPSVAEMYPRHPAPARTTVHVEGAAVGFEGAGRPGHFDGVATVLALLFNLAGPCTAFFGEKDFQQLSVVRQMVEDLDLPVEVVGCPTVREEDGLAMSSRNVRLGPEGRVSARALSAALAAGIEALGSGSVTAAEAAMAAVLEAEAGVEPIYAAVVDPATMATPESAAAGDELRLLVAASVDGVRLLDNLPGRLGPA